MSEPGARCYHEAIVYGTEMWLWGGGRTINPKSVDDLFPRSTIFTYSGDGRWNVQEARATSSDHVDLPPPCLGASCTVVGDEIYSFGGRAKEGYSNDLYVLNSRMEWRKVAVGGRKPSPRASCGLSYVNGKLFTFGGRGHKQLGEEWVQCGNTYINNELHSFDLKTGQWDRVETTGQQPESRFLHFLCSVGGKLVVCGGLGHDQRPLLSIFVLDTERMRWNELIPVLKELVYISVALPVLSSNSFNSCLLIGGVQEQEECADIIRVTFLLDVNTFQWYKVPDVGVRSLQIAHTACLLKETANAKMRFLIYGGLPLTESDIAIKDFSKCDFSKCNPADNMVVFELGSDNAAFLQWEMDCLKRRMELSSLQVQGAQNEQRKLCGAVAGSEASSLKQKPTESTNRILALTPIAKATVTQSGRKIQITRREITSQARQSVTIPITDFDITPSNGTTQHTSAMEHTSTPEMEHESTPGIELDIPAGALDESKQLDITVTAHPTLQSVTTAARKRRVQQTDVNPSKRSTSSFLSVEEDCQALEQSQPNDSEQGSLLVDQKQASPCVVTPFVSVSSSQSTDFDKTLSLTIPHGLIEQPTLQLVVQLTGKPVEDLYNIEVKQRSISDDGELMDWEAVQASQVKCSSEIVRVELKQLKKHTTFVGESQSEYLEFFSKQLEFWIVGSPHLSRTMCIDVFCCTNRFVPDGFEQELATSRRSHEQLKVWKGPETLVADLDTDIRIYMSTKHTSWKVDPSDQVMSKQILRSSSALHSVSFGLISNVQEPLEMTMCKCLVKSAAEGRYIMFTTPTPQKSELSKYTEEPAIRPQEPKLQPESLVSDIQLYEVAKAARNEWYAIGLYLSLPDEELNGCRQYENTDRRLMDVLQKWKRQVTSPTVGALLTACKRAGVGGAAERAMKSREGND